jgi:hypothetical protein
MQSKKSPTEIHKVVVEVYGENVISRMQVSVWWNEFKEGRMSLLDDEPVIVELNNFAHWSSHELKEIEYTFNSSRMCWNSYSRCQTFPHTAGKTRETIEKMGWEILEHPPSRPWPRTLWLPPVWKVEKTPVRKTFCLWPRSGKWNKKLAYQLGRKFLFWN